MNVMLEQLLRELDASPIALSEVSASRGVVTVELSMSGVHGGLICNEAAESVTLRRGRKIYGAYTVADEGYGHWIKGDDASECVAQLCSWFRGRAIHRGVARAPARLDLGAAGSLLQNREPAVLALKHEICERSAYRMRADGVLASPSDDDQLQLSTDADAVSCLVARERLDIVAPTIGLHASAILGFADAVSQGSDD